MCTSTHDDPFTMKMRLCDDDGNVSDQPIQANEPPGDRTYLDRLNRLRNASRAIHGSKAEALVGPFTCTGHAHLAGEHIECTSPAHQQTVAAPIVAMIEGAPGGIAFSGFGQPFTVIDDGKVVVMEKPVGVLFPRPPAATATTTAA